MFRSVGSVLFGIAADRYGRKWPFIVNNLLFIALELVSSVFLFFSQLKLLPGFLRLSLKAWYGSWASQLPRGQGRHLVAPPRLHCRCPRPRQHLAPVSLATHNNINHYPILAFLGAALNDLDLTCALGYWFLPNLWAVPCLPRALWHCHGRSLWKCRCHRPGRPPC
jgi:MFS family permease